MESIFGKYCTETLNHIDQNLKKEYLYQMIFEDDKDEISEKKLIIKN